jgi:hypothetical protein
MSEGSPKVSWECTGPYLDGTRRWQLLIERESTDIMGLTEYIYIDARDITAFLDSLAALGEPQETCQ